MVQERGTKMIVLFAGRPLVIFFQDNVKAMKCQM